MAANRQWVLKTRPEGLVGPEHFTWTEAPAPEPKEGQVLLRTLYLSFDPTQRGWLHPVAGYMPPVQIGEVMRAGGIGQIVQSRNPNFKEGEIVQGMLGWQDYVCVEPGGMMPLQKLSRDYPLTWNMSVIGVTALTAYFGLLDVGKFKAGDQVLVSGAAGATGSVVGQIARIKGAKKVVGIAGGREKCRWLTEKGGFDGAIDYKNEDIDARIRALCPGGVDVFFDNVGGAALDAGLLNLANGARIVICGGIASGYSSWASEGPKHYMNLILHGARMEGFLVLTFAPRFGEAIRDLLQWKKEGKLHVEEYLVEGLEKAPQTLQGLFTGQNLGKTIMKVADPR